jgi:hypothetical protein
LRLLRVAGARPFSARHFNSAHMRAYASCGRKERLFHRAHVQAGFIKAAAVAD